MVRSPSSQQQSTWLCRTCFLRLSNDFIIRPPDRPGIGSPERLSRRVIVDNLGFRGPFKNQTKATESFDALPEIRVCDAHVCKELVLNS